MNPYKRFKEEICSNCKGICEKGIVVIKYNGITQVRCIDYIQKEKPKGYKEPIERTARQLGSLMGFTQEY